MMFLEFTACMCLAMQSCCATHISMERLLNRRLKKTSVVKGSVVHNFSRLLRTQLEEIEMSIWQVKTCCLRWYGRWQLIRRLPWHFEGAERVCCRQPIHNCFRCCVLAIKLDTAQQVILQRYCEAIINAPRTGTSNIPHKYCKKMAPPCAVWKRTTPKAPVVSPMQKQPVL